MPDIRCPECGGRTTIRTTKEGDSQYFVCAKYPKCKGRVPVEEDLSVGLGQESPAPEAAQDSPRQRRVPSSAKSVSDAGVKRPGSKGRVSPDKNWGDDWGDEMPAPKPAPDRARRHVAPKLAEAPGKKEPPSPRPKIAARKEERPEPQRRKALKAGTYRPLYKKGPGPGPVLPQDTEIQKPAPGQTIFKTPKKWETVSEEQGREGSQPVSSRAQYRRKPKAGPVLPQEPEKPKPAPYRPQYQRPPRWGTLPEEKERSEYQGQMGSQSASYRPQYRRMLKPAPVVLQEPGGPPPPYKPLFPRAEKRALHSGKQEPPKPRRRKAPKAAHEELRTQEASKPAKDSL